MAAGTGGSHAFCLLLGLHRLCAVRCHAAALVSRTAALGGAYLVSAGMILPPGRACERPRLPSALEA